MTLYTVLLLIALLLANLPWVSKKLFCIFPIAAKNLAWSLFELMLLYVTAGLLLMGVEQIVDGQVKTQDWEFYTVTFCLFLVFSFPGFVYSYWLRK